MVSQQLMVYTTDVNVIFLHPYMLLADVIAKDVMAVMPLWQML